MNFSECIIEIKNNRAIVKMLFCFFFRAMITINVSKMSVKCQCFFMIL